MSVARLHNRPVARIWGRLDLPPWTGCETKGEPIGEIWFEDDRGESAELLVKYLFTVDRLSVQVHPDDEAARAAGHSRGKEEAWFIVDAAQDALIGLGLKEEVSKAALRHAALDGSIEGLIDWRPVRPGEFFYSPAGTVHAIGSGLTILEIQQNVDLTYRLYDYGRPRELQLTAGIDVADPRPWRAGFSPCEIGPGRTLLHAGGAFVLERWTGNQARTIAADLTSTLVIPLRDGGELGGEPLTLGAVFRVDGQSVVSGNHHTIVAYPGGKVRLNLLL